MLMEKPQCNFQNCRYCFDGNCRSADKYENCKLTDLHYEIARLTVDLDNAKSEWISVEERLPEKGEYLVTYHPCWWDNVQYDHVCVGIDTFRGKTSWAKKKFQRVTHWMPLPMPPKGDDCK